MGCMTTTADRYRTLADAFEAKVAAVPDGAWTNRTPCAEWDARQLVDHVVEVHGMMLAPLGRSLRDASDEPLGAFRSARADVEAVLDDPALADTEYDGQLGRTTVGDTIDRFLGFDLVVHGWDLARATGQDEAIDPAEVERTWAMASAMGDTMREYGVTGPEVAVPQDARQQDRLLGLLGREP
jgi:uncharacterized protein (TIGR03086 family)